MTGIWYKVREILQTWLHGSNYWNFFDAEVVELVDTPSWGGGGHNPSGFKSRLRHHNNNNGLADSSVSPLFLEPHGYHFSESLPFGQMLFWCLKNHGYETPKQALETNSKARCGVLYPPLCGIVRLTNFNSLRFWTLSLTINKQYHIVITGKTPRKVVTHYLCLAGYPVEQRSMDNSTCRYFFALPAISEFH